MLYVCAVFLLKSIDPGQQFTWEHSNLEVNKPKNRYANVIAYDHSRVLLSAIEGKENQCYLYLYFHGFKYVHENMVLSRCSAINVYSYVGFRHCLFSYFSFLIQIYHTWHKISPPSYNSRASLITFLQLSEMKDLIVQLMVYISEPSCGCPFTDRC